MSAQPLTSDYFDSKNIADQFVGKSFFEDADPVTKYCVAHTVKQTPIEQEVMDATIKNCQMSIMLGAPEVLATCQNFIELIQAKRVLDVGSFTGASALSFALALPEDGKVISMDITHDELDRVGMPILSKHPEILKKIDFIKAPAIDTLEKLLANGEEGKFDFAFVDADKESYPKYYPLVMKLLRKRGVLICDNALFFKRVLDPNTPCLMAQGIRAVNSLIVADQNTNSMLINIADGIHLVFKK
uniref:Catechol O-methyltransferase domain-containing protein 1 n=1 Tax=Rhabditophanes sp. KR3021 TaxID=114890 RepID=A0AC35UHT2_9BILA